MDEDELAWGHKRVRANFVRISWSALFGADLIPIVGALIGSLVDPLRDIAIQQKWTFVGIGIGLVITNSRLEDVNRRILLSVGAVGNVPMVAVTCNHALRHNTPINFIMLVLQSCCMAGGYMCFSAITLCQWLVPSFLTAIQSYLLLVILFTFCLDVGKCVPYILATLLSASGLIGVFIFLYDESNVQLWVVVLLPLIVLIYNLMNSTSAITVMRKSDLLELDDDDYLLGAVYFRIGGDAYINCCLRST